MFENKKILILGMARSGYEAAKYLSRFNNTIIVNDGGAKEKQDVEKISELEKLGVTLIFGSHPDDLLDDSFDYIIKNPGINNNHKYVTLAKQLNIPVINEVEMAYLLLPKDVTLIGITGSNGKTTTTTLTYEMIKSSGKRVHLAGNIGYPLCSFLDKVQSGDIIVMEVSCQQLANTDKFKPHIGLMTNLAEAHIDFFGSYEAYKEVKLKLFKNQTEDDIAILNIENKDVMEGTKNILSCTKYFSSKRVINGAYFNDNKLYYYDEMIMDRDEFFLKGNHNVENALGALMIAKEVGISTDVIVKVLKTFKGVTHRLEFIDEVNGVKYYNDTEATNTKCTQIALNSFDDDIILILGGLERGQDFHDLDNYMKNVKEIIGIGQCRDRVKEYGADIGIKTTIYERLHEAFDYISLQAKKGDVVLLSPASASWDQYKQCEDRGDEFKDLVSKLKHKGEGNED